MNTEKTCPKCPSPSKMKLDTNMMNMIPAMIGDRESSRTSETLGVLVEVYRCPLCRFVELYEHIHS